LIDLEAKAVEKNKVVSFTSYHYWFLKKRKNPRTGRRLREMKQRGNMIYGAENYASTSIRFPYDASREELLMLSAEDYGEYRLGY